MRMIRNTPDQLVIAHSPWLYALMLGGFAAVFLITGFNAVLAGELNGLVFLVPVALCALFFRVLVNPVRVIFDRPSRSVEIIKTSLTGRTRVTHSLDEITLARLRKMKTSKGFTRSQMNLVIAGGQSGGWHPISDMSGARSHYRLTDLINAWLKAAR